MERNTIPLKNRFSALEIEENESKSAGNLDAIMEKERGWVKIERTLDSGAANHALPKRMFPEITSRTHSEGRYFYGADGSPIKNFGEKKIEFQTPGGNRQQIRWQVADVVRPLISMGKLEDAGCIMDLANKDTKAIINPITKEKIPVVKKNGTYRMTLWVDESKTGQGFRWQGEQ